MPDPEKPETKPVDITRQGLSRLGYAFAAEPKPEEKPADATPPAAPAAPAPEPEAKPAAEAPAPETPAEGGGEQKAGEAAAPAAAPEGDQPVAAAPEKRVKKVAAPAAAPTPGLTREDLLAAVREAVKPAATPAAPATPVAPAKPQLQAPDQEELEFIQYAAEAEPEKYKDLPEKYVAFVRARDAFVEQQVRENGSFDPQSEEFKAFVERNRPTLQRGDRKKLEVRQIEERAIKRAREEFQEKEQKIMREVRAIKVEPVIQREATGVIERVLSIDDPVVKAFKEDPKKAVEENPLEAPEVAAAARDTSVLTESYLRIANGLEEPDLKNPVHAHLDAFISKQGEILDAKPEGERVMEDGRILVSPAALQKMVAEKNPLAQRYTTFTDQHIIAMLEEGARLRISGRLKVLRSNLERAGYKRPAAAPAAPTKPTGEAAAPAAPTKATPQAVSSSKGAPPPPASAGSGSKHPGLKALGFS